MCAVNTRSPAWPGVSAPGARGQASRPALQPRRDQGTDGRQLPPRPRAGQMRQNLYLPLNDLTDLPKRQQHFQVSLGSESTGSLSILGKKGRHSLLSGNYKRRSLGWLGRVRPGK